MNCLAVDICKVLSSLWVLNVATATFFHEHSYTEIKPIDVTPTSDFGFALSYWPAHEALVIGAPHHDLDGQVFSRSLKDIFKEKTAEAEKMDINVDKLAGNYNRSLSPNQNFCLGASISVFKENILTCAPLWTTQTPEFYGAFGTCFVVNDHDTFRYQGKFERNSSHTGKLYGGTGWSTLGDEKNNLMLISISPLSTQADASYIEGPQLTKPVKFLALFSDMNFKTQKLYKNMGTFVSGQFFDKHITHYAYSARNEKTVGVVGFFKNPITSEGEIRYIMEKGGNVNRVLILSSNKGGTMFGAALCSSDLNVDGYSDLIVGEPALGKEYYESGAINIYLGGDKKKKKPKVIIHGNVPGGRFGTTIASTDLDRDKVPEIFVSAPFENSGDGAVYIISGYEIEKLFDPSSRVIEISLSELILTQRIQNKEYKWFGYSLQVLPDLDVNGYDDLAIGAPQSAKVVLYRSIPSITVQVSACLINRTVVYVNDMNFGVRVDLKITHPTKSTIHSAKLLATVKLIGNRISFDPDSKDTYNFTKIVSNENKVYSQDLSFKLARKEKGMYSLTITVQGDVEDYLSAQDFSHSMVRLSPRSELTYTLPIHRQCHNDGGCEPRLSPSFIWPGGNEPYVLGSTINETMTVVVTNEGTESYESCAKIWIEGSQVDLIDCSKIEMEHGSGYNCPLTKLITDKTQKIDILLDMSKQYSSDSMLRVNVLLYDICSQDKFTAFNHTVLFIHDADQLVIDGVSHERNVTDGEIESESKTITEEHEFILINQGIVTWKSINATINIQEQNMEAYRLVSPPEGVNCIEINTTSATFYCNINLERKKTLKIKIIFTVAKDKFINNLQDEMLNASSTFVMHLPTNEHEQIVTKLHTVTTTFHFVRDKSWGQNKHVIIALAVLGSFIIMGVIAFILHKIGFFERKDKEKLTQLKQDINQRRSQVPELAEEVIEEENVNNT